jgi:hypothetical protein
MSSLIGPLCLTGTARSAASGSGVPFPTPE